MQDRITVLGILFGQRFDASPQRAVGATLEAILDRRSTEADQPAGADAR
jgi:hypothetical protein